MTTRRLLVAFGVLALLGGNVATAQQHHHGGDKGCRPTREERREAALFARRAIAAVQKYEDPGAAYEDDFYPWVDTWKAVYHFINYDNYYDWRILDPKQPEALVYAHTFAGPKLIGVMFSMEDPNRKPPPMGGCITRWHTHPQCTSPVGYSHIWDEDFGDCPPGWEEDEDGSELMLHVWTVPMKDGPYSFHPDPKWECWPRPAPC